MANIVNDNELLRVAKCALADLEGIMPEFESSGDRAHPAWKTILELREAITKAEPHPDDIFPYLVIWKVDTDARNPEEAALEALRMHRDPESLATNFEVTDKKTGETVQVDLYELQHLL